MPRLKVPAIRRISGSCALALISAFCGCGGTKPPIAINSASAFSGNEKFEMAKKEVIFSHAHVEDTVLLLRMSSADVDKAKPTIAPAFAAARKIAIASFAGNLTSEKQKAVASGSGVSLEGSSSGQAVTTTWLEFSDNFKKIFLAYAHDSFVGALKRQSREFELIPVQNVITNDAYAAMPYGDAIKSGLLKSHLLGDGPALGVAAPGYKFMLPPVGERYKGDTIEAQMAIQGMNPGEGLGLLNTIKGLGGVLGEITRNRKDPLADIKKDMAGLAAALDADLVLTVENGIIGNLSPTGIKYFYVDRIIVNAFDRKGELVWSGRLETPVLPNGNVEGADVESVWNKLSDGYRLACDLIVYKMVLDHGGTPNTADSPPLPDAAAVQQPFAVDKATAAAAAPKPADDAAAKTAKVHELAKKGNSNAQFLLARMYFSGKHVKQDLPTAFIWCRKAALKGHKDAPFFLGAMYYEGKGTAQNFPEAFKWLKKAADGRNSRALFMIGEMYYGGKGVAQSNAEAEKYYSEAAKLGHKGAEAKLAEIAKPKNKSGFDMDLGGFGTDNLGLGNP